MDKMRIKPHNKARMETKSCRKVEKRSASFFKGALEIGTAVNEAILEKVMKVFDLNKGDDAVFRTKNGAPNNF